MPFSIASPATPFPVFLTSSLPFPKRQSPCDRDLSSPLTTPDSSPNNTPLSDSSYLSGSTSHLRCVRCNTDLASSSQIISKGFTGRHGRAYLISSSSSSHSSTPLVRSTKAKNEFLPDLPNIVTHRPVPRQLVTGAHTVGDISCAQCGSVLGWKYIAAEEDAQQYKVGKFILETKRVCRATTWDVEGCEGARGKKKRDNYEDVEFDSQDEDECEDLFTGVWTPQLAAKRRQSKISV